MKKIKFTFLVSLVITGLKFTINNAVKVICTAGTIVISNNANAQYLTKAQADTLYKLKSYVPKMNTYGFSIGFDSSGVYYDAPRPDYRFNIDYYPLLSPVATSGRFDDLIYSFDVDNLPQYYHKYQSDTLHKLNLVGKVLTIKTGTLAVNSVTIPSVTSSEINLAAGGTVLISEVDGSVTNELQTLSGSGTKTITLSNSGGNFIIPSVTSGEITAALGLPALTTETQSLSLNSGSISIKSGSVTINTIVLPTNTISLVSTLTAMSTKSLNVAYQVLTTNDTRIYLSAQISCNLSLSGGTDGSIVLEISPNGSTGWIYAGQIDGSNTGTLTIGLNTTQKTGSTLSCGVKAGYYWRLRTVSNTGTPTFTWNGGSYETY